MGHQYGVAREFRTKREAQKYAKKCRDDGYGARVIQVSGGWMVRRTNRLIRR